LKKKKDNKKEKKKNGAKISQEKTQWGWNLKTNYRKQKKLQLKKLEPNLKDYDRLFID
jgi:hypothetical protein